MKICCHNYYRFPICLAEISNGEIIRFGPLITGVLITDGKRVILSPEKVVYEIDKVDRIWVVYNSIWLEEIKVGSV